MSNDVGGIDFTVHLNAKGAIVEARVAGNAIGHELDKGIDNGTASLGQDVGKLFDKMVPNAKKSLRSVSREFDSSTVHAKAFRSAIKDAGDDGLWNKLSFNARQAVVIVGAIAASGSDIAGLGVAAGGGLAILAAGLADVAIGGGVALAAFAKLNKGVDAVPDAIKPAAKAFADLKAEFSDLQSQIATAAFQNAAPAFKSITATVKALSPALQGVGSVLGNIIDQFANGVAPGTKTFGYLNTIIQNSGPILQKMATAAGKVGDALLAGLANKSVNKAVGDLVDSIGKIGDSIQHFVDDGGLDTWMKNTESVFKHLTPLFVDAGKAIGNLVTPDAIKRLNNLLDNVDDFVKTTAGPLLDIASRFDVFGLIAQALKQVGDVLQPLLKPLGDLFDVLHRIVGIAIDEWGKDLKPIAAALAPVVQNMADFLKSLDPQVIKDTADALLIFAGAVAGFKLLNGIEVLIGKLGSLKGAFSGAGGEAKTAGGKIADGFGSALSGAAAGYIVSQFADDLTNGFGSMKIGKIDFKPAAQGAVDQWSGALAGAAAGAKYGGPVGAMIGGISGALASVDWGVVTSTLTDPNYKGTKAIQDGFKQGPFFGLVEMIKSNPDIPQKVGSALGTALSHMWDFTGEVASAPFNWVSTNIIGPLTQAFAPENIGTTFQLAVGAITAPFATISGWMQTNVITPITTMFTNLPLNLQIGIGAIGETIGNFFAPAVGFVQNNVITPITSFFLTLPINIAAGIGTIGETIGNFFAPAVSFVQGNVITPIVSFFANLPGNIGAFIGNIGTTVGNFFQSLPATVGGFVDRVVSFFQALPGRIMQWIGGLGSRIAAAINPGNLWGSLVPPGHASGALVLGPETARIGEAGPEMVVPLARPLNQVDPAVRRVAAFAQGKPVSGGGDGVSIGKQVNVSDGAIVISGVSDGRLAATTALDEAVRKL